jgi:hypothetical protein
MKTVPKSISVLIAVPRYARYSVRARSM